MRADSAVQVLKEMIDFVNLQSGAYMDAIAGYAGHSVRVERQVHRVMRPTKVRADEAGKKVVVTTSYEDPTKPDIILNRIVRASDYLAANRPGGTNEQQHARAIVVFTFSFWEHEIRPRLAAALGPGSTVTSDIMGDLRYVRNAILHNKSVLSTQDHAKLKKVGDMFAADGVVHIGYEDLHRIFVLIKQDCARLLLEWTGEGATAPFKFDELLDLAVQGGRPVSPS